MCLRANAADSCRDARHFLDGSPYTELLEAAQFGYLKVRVGNLAVVVQKNVNLSVTLKSSYGIYFDLPHDFSTLRKIE